LTVTVANLASKSNFKNPTFLGGKGQQISTVRVTQTGSFHVIACNIYTPYKINKAIVDYTSPALCTPVTPSRRQAMRPIVSMPEEVRATDIGNMHKYF